MLDSGIRETEAAQATAAMEALVETAVQETADFKADIERVLTEEAPPTTTPTPTVTDTPVPSETPTPTETIYDDPWTFQEVCKTIPENCVQYSIDNKQSETWINVILTDLGSDVSEMFSVRPYSLDRITLVPGQYKAVFTKQCGDKIQTIVRVGPLGSFTDVFLCKEPKDTFTYAGRK